MNIDVIVTTYNRAESVGNLVKQILECSPCPNQVIVVDSSENVNTLLKSIPKVTYIISSHKNQPYQRLLGSCVSEADVVVFLDDDLEIINYSIFEAIVAPFNSVGIVGSSVAFVYARGNSNKIQLDPTDGYTNSLAARLFRRFTGVPSPDAGVIHSLGVVGKKPDENGEIGAFNGANMAFRKALIQNIIPYDLLSMVELKLNTGEDKVISMLASQYGILWYSPQLFLLHPFNESTYFQDDRTFSKKVTYSRLYLSRIYAQVFKKPMWKEYLLYYWFTLWRLIIAIASWIIQPSKSRKGKLLGVWDGLWLSITLPQRAERLTPDINWQVEIEKDLKGANFPNV